MSAPVDRPNALFVEDQPLTNGEQGSAFHFKQPGDRLMGALMETGSY
jgi:hypothetical protein